MLLRHWVFAVLSLALLNAGSKNRSDRNHRQKFNQGERTEKRGPRITEVG